MASKRGVRVTLLVEDRRIERFAFAVLQRLGFHRKELFVETYPVGQGSAKKWIDKRYARLVRVHRSKATFQKLALLVGTDADELSVTDRGRQLAECLEVEELSPRNDDEAIVHWIPRWHIETWILALLGEEVDEDHNYKSRVSAPSFDQIAVSFVEQLRTQSNTRLPPSLVVAFAETNRLPN